VIIFLDSIPQKVRELSRTYSIIVLKIWFLGPGCILDLLYHDAFRTYLYRIDQTCFLP